MGLFMGVSIISFIEVFYYAIIRPYFMYREHRSEMKARQPPSTMENESEKQWISESRVQYIADINHEGPSDRPGERARERRTGKAHAGE